MCVCLLTRLKLVKVLESSPNKATAEIIINNASETLRSNAHEIVSSYEAQGTEI